ncbi:Exodeoxyribonuclease III [Sandaracinus amylolyticus]|uniref:Exodeoxyribonuclease III n=1 Tax=Sandaracinus amylolyticus TaxID=927083 RepID=A0A0F6W449_9BACT|nr:exodeoxyribonuclease III [Sandaracinus amylolyticus]AKF07012.1 Exodeoxyribonuclease III [Sandaracinus amylolyticus]
MPIKIITWNVNSIRARHDRLLALLARHEPDVLCLQELKLEEAKFPWDEVRAAGYHAAVLGQKSYNGVAILSRTAPEDVRRGMGDGEEDGHARLISARLHGIRVYSAYFPNGGTPDSDKYAFKLAWMARLEKKLRTEHTPDEALALCGDFNVAPTDLDVKNVEKWADTVLCRPDARAALERIRGVGLIDSLRRLRPEEGNLYSYWDYQMLGFPKNDGLRIDHVDVTAPLAERLLEVRIDREERKGKQPSDHAPVIATFA